MISCRRQSPNDTLRVEILKINLKSSKIFFCSMFASGINMSNFYNYI